MTCEQFVSFIESKESVEDALIDQIDSNGIALIANPSELGDEFNRAKLGSLPKNE